ncbi:hypothetical protein [Pseudomonas proteolytica]|uniref:hypothetical protein n=1 Tax=Pseudomonas proteolytica TaxID=219574 RepID=UPI001475AE9D|nr:hypothetical protein [Pseudomonas proteolytica]NMZ39140.1 hypothetical protein [Pseudomonas proteolytica]
MSTTEKLSQQESFNHGVVAALHALKTGLQATPGFNNEALLHIVRGLLNNPSSKVDLESFNAPILALLHDHIIDEHGNMKTKEVSRT